MKRFRLAWELTNKLDFYDIAIPAKKIKSMVKNKKVYFKAHCVRCSDQREFWKLLTELTK